MNAQRDKDRIYARKKLAEHQVPAKSADGGKEDLAQQMFSYVFKDNQELGEALTRILWAQSYFEAEELEASNKPQNPYSFTRLGRGDALPPDERVSEEIERLCSELAPYEQYTLVFSQQLQKELQALDPEDKIKMLDMMKVIVKH